MSILSQFFPGISGTYASTIPLNILVQAGGGGGGGHLVGGITKAGGGGAGGLGFSQNYRVSPGITCPITVGSGGAAGTPSPTDGGLVAAGNGGFSAFNVPINGNASSIRVEGGGAGGSTSTLAPLARGSDGGCGGGSALGPAPFTNGARGYYTSVITSRTISYMPPGPSAGASAPIDNITAFDHTTTEWGVAMGMPGSYGNITYFPGAPGSNFTYQRCHGGSTSYINTNFQSNGVDLTGVADYAGKISYITGTAVAYGAGGGQTPTAAPIPASGHNVPTTANTGNGGNAGAFPSPLGPGGNFNGQAGQSGVVVVQYPSAYPAAPAFPGASDVSPATPGFRTYRFTSSGSITLP